MGIENYSASASLNTTLGGLNIAEGMTRADVDDAFRQLMADIASGVIPAIQPKKYGATGDGVTNDRAAFVATDAVGPFEIPSGDYLISTSLTIINDVRFRPGARLIIPTGVTITFSGQVDAPVRQIFVCSGTGAVVFNWSKTAAGYMEWWGAKSDNSTDCLASWNAATKALLLTKGTGGDYQFSATAKLIYSNRAFHGVSSAKYNSGIKEVTRFLVSGGSSVALQIGPDTNPGTINQFQYGNDVRDVYVTRTVAPVISSDCVGVRVQYVQSATIEHVKAAEHMIGFEFYGSVYTVATECESVRSIAGTGAGTDYWFGFNANGSASIGAAGGNASLYLTRPSASCNIAALQTGNSRGINITSNFSDLFLEYPEDTNCYYGICITGNSTTGLDSGNCDLRILNHTSDQFHQCAIYITNLASSGIVQILQSYAGPSSNARASYWFNACLGQISMSLGELDHQSAPAVQGFIIDGSNNVQVLGTAIKEVGSTYVAVGLNNANNCRIEPAIRNASATGQVAIQLSGTCTANAIRPTISGKASAFTKGIDVSGTGDARNEYNLTGIDSACISGGSANKLVRNAVQIVATGLTGTNLVSGVTT